MLGNDFFTPLLEERPELTFNAFLNDRGYGSPSGKRSFLQRSMDDLLGRFHGRLGAQIRAGETPSATWNEFLFGGNGQDPFDLDQYFASFSPFQRGEMRSRFAPRTQHLLHF